MGKSVKGLLVKDIRLLWSQYKLFCIMQFCCCIALAEAGSFGEAFVVGYSAMMAAIVVLGTFTFDEFENGMPFLLALPVSRRDYVGGKFLLGIVLMTLASIVMAVAVAVWKGAETGTMDYMAMAASLLTAYLMLAIEIPLQLIFGQGKGRAVTVIVMGCMAGGFMALKALDVITVAGIIGLARDFIGLGSVQIVALAYLAIAALLIVSYGVSCRVMERKEY